MRFLNLQNAWYFLQGFPDFNTFLQCTFHGAHFNKTTFKKHLVLFLITSQLQLKQILHIWSCNIVREPSFFMGTGSLVDNYMQKRLKNNFFARGWCKCSDRLDLFLAFHFIILVGKLPSFLGSVSSIKCCKVNLSN